MSEERRVAVVTLTGEQLTNKLGLPPTAKPTRAKVVETEAGVEVHFRIVGDCCPVVPSGGTPQTVSLESLRIPEAAPPVAGKPEGKTVKKV